MESSRWKAATPAAAATATTGHPHRIAASCCFQSSLHHPFDVVATATVRGRRAPFQASRRPNDVPVRARVQNALTLSSSLSWMDQAGSVSLSSLAAFPSHLQSTSQLLSTTTATATTTTTFEPVLSIPALIVFVFIATIFAALQWRIGRIEAAVAQRTVALRRLRELSTTSLGDPVAVPYDRVQDAIDEYRQAYTRVEDLRTIVPGIARIVPPPSQTLSRHVKVENERAALQFLGIPPESNEQGGSPSLGRSSSSSSGGGVTGISRSSSREDVSKSTDEDDGKLTSPLLIAILLLVGISQLALLSLLMLSDPMAAVSDVTMVNTLTGFE